MKIACAAVAAIIVWGTLGLQFYISVQLYMSKGITFAGGIIQVLSYFTILINILVAVTYTYIALSPNTKPGKFLVRSSTITATAVYIGIVGFIYNLVLRDQWNPQGWFKVADTLLHTVSPTLFVVFWLIFVPKENLKWQLAIKWLLFPFLYLIYSLIRGQIIGTYPYFFVDVARFGYKQTAINCSLVLLAFVSFGLVFISISRLLSKEADNK